jgi:hypothetical protein
MRGTRRQGPVIAVTLGLLALFLFRLGYGLTSEFWSEDERQIYLIGLRSFARHEWPYFGPDIVWTESRIPGALQGLLVAGPLFLWPVPESPFVLLNLLSFAALCLFAWYCGRRLPELPPVWLWLWIMTAPWTLNFSTHVVNPSYVLPPAVLFFVGFFEAAELFRGELLPVRLAYALMGFGLACIAQLHLSFVLLPPFVLLALVRPAARPRGGALLALGLGAAIPLGLLLPTLLKFGLGGTQRNVGIWPLGLWTLLTVLARFLSFASFEINRFLGLSDPQRLLLLARNPWLAIPVVFSGLVGIVQPFLMLFLSFGRWSRPGWTALRLMTLATVVWIYLIYFFAAKEPWAHAFYVAFPLAMYFSLHCWVRLAGSSAFGRLAAAALVSGVLLHLGLAWARAPLRSLYRDRATVVAAIEQREDRLLGERRYSSGESPPPPPGDPRADLRVVRSRQETAARGRVAVWHVRIRNDGQPAYSDIRYVTRYWDTSGQPRGNGGGVLKEILQPGDVRLFEFADGWSDVLRVRGEVEIVGADRLLPAHR